MLKELSADGALFLSACILICTILSRPEIANAQNLPTPAEILQPKSNFSLLQSNDSTRIVLGSRRELMVDDFLIEQSTDLIFKLHTPIPQNVAIVFDAPWEGNTSAYHTIFQDGPIYRMYYRGSDFDLNTKTSGPQSVCYAESRDGKSWYKPKLGLCDFKGSKKNNIVWNGTGTHNFTPFKDANPNTPAAERYKAVASHEDRLFAFKSADGLHWSLLQAEPIITQGTFDSQNICFWDSVRQCYLAFHRDFRDGIRDILTSTSADFRNWSTPVWLAFDDALREHLYTNTILPYFRAPQLLLGFPMRFMPNRQLGAHPNPGVSDGVFMTSRDGLHWRRWGEAFIRPGLQAARWINRNNMTAWGLLLTRADIPGLPDELSLYSTEGYYVKDCRLRRFTLRQDGFVSLNATLSGGSFVTRVLVFAGTELHLNFAT
ncbi:hypothetical protein L0128_16690, partial [candidate division KSB1 bacterium]|nr:hypothetical protein [candidate division KSB1 bacterium]